MIEYTVSIMATKETGQQVEGVKGDLCLDEVETELAQLQKFAAKGHFPFLTRLYTEQLATHIMAKEACNA